MINLRPVLFIIGILLSLLAAFMLIPAFVDLANDHEDWQVFIAASGLTLFVGVSLILSNRTGWQKFTLRQAFLLTAMSWIVISLFAALPFLFGELDLTFTDAFFETMSGLTTTGATVLVGLENLPPGILLWRGILQWLGGIGIIVIAVSILPALQVSGMQLFRIEGFETDKILPRAAQIAVGIMLVYSAATFVAAIVLGLLGMNALDAAVHAMTSIATAGFSNYDSSIGHFDNPAIHYALMVMMIFGALPFPLYLRFLQGNWGVLTRDTQVRGFFLALLLFGSIFITWVSWQTAYQFPDSIRLALFNVVSILTTTGYASAPYDTWGGFGLAGFFALMFIGGCAGSTSSAMKIFRLQILFKSGLIQLKRSIQPHGVFKPYYAGKPVPESVSLSVMSFFYFYMASLVILSMCFSLFGLDFITSISAAASVLGNIGPGLGEMIGPQGTYRDIPSAMKWIMCVGMLMGRLEFFTILVLFVPQFWRS